MGQVAPPHQFRQQPAIGGVRDAPTRDPNEAFSRRLLLDQAVEFCLVLRCQTFKQGQRFQGFRVRQVLLQQVALALLLSFLVQFVVRLTDQAGLVRRSVSVASALDLGHQVCGRISGIFHAYALDCSGDFIAGLRASQTSSDKSVNSQILELTRK